MAMQDQRVRRLLGLLHRLEGREFDATDFIPWASPVLSFGDLHSAKVATLGLNPSNREFLTSLGSPLDESARRFPTLSSLGLQKWTQARAQHAEAIIDDCATYFERNPYDTWFRQLDRIITALGCSYYDPTKSAVHLDLVPFSTFTKWGALSRQQQVRLLSSSQGILGTLLRDSSIHTLLLNGRSVVQQFTAISNARLHSFARPGWSLKRSTGTPVAGILFVGNVSMVDSISLGRVVRVAGFNHNLQSSFGVTLAVRDAIAHDMARNTAWEGAAARETA